jgi:hypothetical protein
MGWVSGVESQPDEFNDRPKAKLSGVVPVNGIYKHQIFEIHWCKDSVSNNR